MPNVFYAPFVLLENVKIIFYIFLYLIVIKKK